MNDVKLYPGIKDKRCYIVEAYGMMDVWSVELDEPIGCVKSKREFKSKAIAAGWIPVIIKKVKATN